jgi:hypothetical protein
VTAFASLALAATVRVVDRVHDGTAHGWANTHPTLDTGFTELTQAVLFISNLANRGPAVNVDLANFTGAQSNLA